MKVLSCCIATAVLLFFADTLHAAGFSVLSPATNRYVAAGQLTVVLAVDRPDAVNVTVKVAGQTYSSMLAQKQGGRHACLPVRLSPGQNDVQIAIMGPSGPLEQGALTIYRRSVLSKRYQVPPEGFQPYYLHTPTGESPCIPCHRMEATLFDVSPERPDASPCYPCHRQLGNAVYTHQPVAAGACFRCHEVVKGKRKYTIRQPVQTTCFMCHSAQAKAWKHKKMRHGPTAVGNCTLCHNPHGSDWPALTPTHPTDLCLNCHNDKQSGLHVIAGFFAKGHPVKGPENPLRKDRPFSCAGCHNPHAGDNQNLLNKERDSLENYCQTCHKL